MEAGPSGPSSLLRHLRKLSFPVVSPLMLFCFVPFAVGLTCCADSSEWDILFPRYISGRFGTQDVAQRWKHKYQEVCNALDMVGFQEQVSSGVI